MESWTEIVRTHGPRAYRAAWRVLGQQQDCEDVVQEAFVEAHKKFAIGEVEHWPTFLNRLVTFWAIDSLRRRRSHGTLDAQALSDQSPSAESAVITSEEEFKLREMVAELPDR